MFYDEEIFLALLCVGVFFLLPLLFSLLAMHRANRAVETQQQLTEKLEQLERRVDWMRRPRPHLASGEPEPSKPIPASAAQLHPRRAGEPRRKKALPAGAAGSATQPLAPIIRAELAPQKAPSGPAELPLATTRQRPAEPTSKAVKPISERAVRTVPPDRHGASVPNWHDWLRGQFATAEWEAVVGGSWLNKVGVLVLVVGLALFLGYSLTHFGAVGRLLIGYLISWGMIVGGSQLLRRTGFRVFAAGLLGGGWAAFYFTVYAMYGLEAARVIHDPLVGITLLAIAAAMMIAHALYYRSEAATATALLFGFVTIVISPVSSFAALASVPLVIAVVTIAHRFFWLRIAISGLVVTYMTYAFRLGGLLFDESATGLAVGQSVLLAYWLCYEVFDLLSLGERRPGFTPASRMFPLNACGFLGVSFLYWSRMSPETLSAFFALAATIYLVSSMMRAKRLPPSRFEDTVDLSERIASGGYEAPITICATFGVFAILNQFTGPSVIIALLLEGAFLFHAGMLLKQTYLRGVALAVYVVLCLRFIAIDLTEGEEMMLAGYSLMSWTPVALLSAASFYFHRILIQPFRSVEGLLMECSYSFVGTALLTLVVLFELPSELIGLTWLVIAVAMLELGIRFKAIEFRFQAAAVGGLAAGAMMTFNGFSVPRQPWISVAMTPAWVWLFPATAILCVVGWQLYRRPLMALASVVEGWRRAVLTLTVALFTTLLWHALASPIVVLGWAVFALLLIEMGFRWNNPLMRFHGHLIAALTFGRLFLANFANPGFTGIISHRMLTVIPIIVFLYYLRSKLNWERSRDRLTAWERSLPSIYLYAPFVLIVVLMRFELGRVFAVLGWSVFSVVLFILGRRRSLRDLRWQSYLVALLVFARCWSSNFNIPDSLAGTFGRIATGAVVIGCFYLCQYLAPRIPAQPAAGARQTADATEKGIERWLIWFDQNARNVFSVLGTVLLGVLVYYEVSGRLLTVAWGVQGTALLIVGFATRERVLRLAGLAILSLCAVKVFLVDLRTLETPFRILSFILLGFLLIAVSWFYTRYHTRIQERA